MVKRFQEGGLNTDDDEDVGLGAIGGLDPSMLMMMSMFGGTSTEESRDYSKRILDKGLAEGPDPMSKAVQAKEAQTAQVRAALRKARETLLAQDFNKGDLLLAASAALGQPTRSGAMGESLSNAVQAIRGPLAERRKFNRERDSALSELDLAEAGADEGVTNLRFQIEQLERQQQGRMEVEALKNLGKPTLGKSPLAGIIPQAAQATDRAYSKEYLDYIQNGQGKASQGLGVLHFASDLLHSGRDTYTGPVSGTIANVPFIGRWLQDITNPRGGDVRDLIEQTVQESLRPILGSQFTQQEGERLIQRLYNPNLEEWRNARRLDYFIKQLERAYASKNALAAYYGKNGTLWGFQAPAPYKTDDFVLPDEIDNAGQEVTAEDAEGLSSAARKVLGTGTRIYGKDDAEMAEIEQAMKEQAEFEAGRGQPTPRLQAKGGRVRPFQKGGPVDSPGVGGPVDASNEIIVRAPYDEDENTAATGIEQLWEALGLAPHIIGGGALTVGLEEVLAGLARRMAVAQNPAHRRVSDAMTRAGIDPVEAAEDVKRGRRAGVPQQLMDVDAPGVQVLAERGFQYGGKDATQALEDLRDRVSGSRERVNDRINAGMKPDRYHDQAEKFTDNVSNEARRQLFQPVFDKYPGIKEDPILTEIIQTPEGQKALDFAMQIYQNTPGKKIGKADIAGMVRKPSLEFYDYVRRGLDRSISREEAKSKEDAPNEMVDVLRELRKTYTDRLDSLAPLGYKAARHQYAGDLEIQDALKKGKNFMKYRPEQLQEMASAMSFHEKNAARTGIAQDLYETLGRSTAPGFNAAQKIIGSEDVLSRLKPFFDNPRQEKIFTTALEREAELFRTGNKLLGRADRARMQGERARQEPLEYVAKRAGGFRFAISPMGWALRLYRDLPNMSEKQAQQVLKLLQSGTPAEMDSFSRTATKLAKFGAQKGARRAAALGIGAAVGTWLGQREGREEENQ